MKYKINHHKSGLFLVGLSAISVMVVLGISLLNSSEMKEEANQTDEFTPPVAEDLTGAPLVENRNIYSNDDGGSLKHIYLTILPVENPEGEYASFEELYAYNMYLETEKPRAQVIFQEGTETSPKKTVMGHQSNLANGILETRGRSTSMTSNKSFKISLSDEAGLWQGQKVINLNKHPYDRTRMRNKLSFDYYKIMPDMASLRTQFVALHIKDLSKNSNAKFENYGLYTHVEQVNKRYLRMHGFDDSGNVYKATNFEFYRYPDVIKLKEDPSYNAAEFNKILEIKGSEDHRALVQMLENLNDISMDIDEVIDKHFNRENYITWLASNIIFGNLDTVSQNFYLYKPTASKTWYFLPWDYDGAWGGRDQTKEEAAQYSAWEKGVSNYWGSFLNRRFLKKDENREALDRKIQELLKLASEEQTEKMLRTYYPVVSAYVSQNPDLSTLQTDMKGFSNEVNRLGKLPFENYQVFKDSLQNPMPIFLWSNEQSGKDSIFSWEMSYDFQKDEIFYDFSLSKLPDMSKPLYEMKGLKITEAKVPILPKGTYYWKVVIKDAKGNEMLPFDSYYSPSKIVYHGVKQYIVE